MNEVLIKNLWFRQKRDTPQIKKHQFQHPSISNQIIPQLNRKRGKPTLQSLALKIFVTMLQHTQVASIDQTKTLNIDAQDF